MKIYEELLSCYSSKNELKFFSVLSTLSDQEIDEILEFCQDMPDNMRYILTEFEEQRNYYKSL